MKKKIKDLTLGEIDKFCKKHCDCYECPFHSKVFQFCPVYDKKTLNKEVEIDAYKNGNTRR